MAYIIQTRYKEGSGDLYAEWRPEHVAYLDDRIDKLLAAGALLDDDGANPHGGVIILDTDDRQEAEDFIANDPLSTQRAGWRTPSPSSARETGV